MFFFKNKFYVEVKECLLWLEVNSYRFYYVCYVFGEVVYGEKRYREVIKYYKESVFLDKKVFYMFVFLWYMVWLFKKIKDD